MLKILKGISIGLLVLALGPWPYEYYQLLRVIVCATSIWCTINYYKNDKEGLAVIFGILALLFNPVSPIYLNRSLWALLDLGAAGVFGYSLVSDKKNSN